METGDRSRIDRIGLARLRDIAVHEAVHAVQARIPGREIGRGSIISDARYAGPRPLPGRVVQGGFLVIAPCPGA